MSFRCRSCGSRAYLAGSPPHGDVDIAIRNEVIAVMGKLMKVEAERDALAAALVYPDQRTDAIWTLANALAQPEGDE